MKQVALAAGFVWSYAIVVAYYAHNTAYFEEKIVVFSRYILRTLGL